MLSRVAEHLYWMGRYTERAENTARLINVNAHLLMDLPRGIAPGWAPLIAISGAPEFFEARYDEYTERNVVKYLIADPEVPESLLYTLKAARENARTIRDVIPREAWEILNELYHYARDNTATALSKRGRHAYLNQLIRMNQTLAGLLLGTMNHNQGYRFLGLGRSLERADMTTRIIDVRSSSLLPDETSELHPFDGVQWMSVLKSLSGYQMYRQKMRARIGRRAVLRFLLHDTEFPRAIARCCILLEGNLRNLPNNDAPRRSLAAVQRALGRADVESLIDDNNALHEFIDDLQGYLAALHIEIAAQWFLSANTNAA